MLMGEVQVFISLKNYKRELNEICHLAWPAIVQEAMSVIVTYVDTAMVGAIGAGASAAVGLTGTVNWLVSSLSIALGIGVLSVVAKADGGDDQEKLQQASQQAFYMTAVMGIVITLICIVISPYLPTWLNGDMSIHQDASSYFLIVSLPYLFKSAVFIFSATLRGVKDMKTPMMINLYMNIMNIILNFLLIYPTRQFFGITIPGFDLGVKGAAIATALSFVVGGILITKYYYENPRFHFKQTGFHYNAKIMKECLDVGIPVMLGRSVLCVGHIVFASLIATLGVVPFAAHTLAIQAEEAFYIPGFGFQSAASTLVGHALGEKNVSKMKQVTYLICTITFSLMMIAGIILFFNAENLMTLFTPDKQVIALGTNVLRIVSVSEPIYGVLIILEGTFNGMGDTKAPFLYSLITMWGIRILGTWCMIHIFHLGLSSVWIMMVCDNVARCFLLVQRFVRQKWLYLIK